MSLYSYVLNNPIRYNDPSGLEETHFPLGEACAILTLPIVGVPGKIAGSGCDAVGIDWLSLGYDHRVIDGATGRRFLAALVDRIEQPE